MEFGLFLIEAPYRPHVGPSGRSAGDGPPSASLSDPEYLTAVAQHAEELGFDFLTFPEHVLLPGRYESRYPYQQYEAGDFKRYPYDETSFPEPVTSLTFVAAVTSRIRLGTSVLILPQRNPVILAKQLATLDALSRGRLRLTIGLGWLREEFDAIGVPWERRGRRAQEYIEAMRALWRDDLASYAGEFVQFDRVRCLPKPAQHDGIPIYVGGHSEAAARRAGRLGDGFMPLGLGGYGMDTTKLVETMRAAAEEAGRDPNALEVISGGQPTLESAEQLAERGVTQTHFVLSAPNLEAAHEELEQIARDVIERM